MKSKKIVIGAVLAISLTQITSLANANNIAQNGIINSQDATNTINNTQSQNITQNNVINSENTTNAVNDTQEQNITQNNGTNSENETNEVNQAQDVDDSSNDIIQEQSVYSIKQNQRVVSKAEKTKENGIYKIAIGKDLNKTIEIAGSDTGNNATVDIWNYRKCISPKILFKL